MRVVVTSKIRATIWSDNAALVWGFRKLLHGNSRLKPSRPHYDLWDALKQLVTQLDEGQLSIVKVLSHVDHAKATNALESWSFFHNEVTDHATRANSMRPPEVLKQLKKTAAAVKQAAALHRAILNVHVRTARRALAAPRQVKHPSKASDSSAPGLTQVDPGDFCGDVECSSSISNEGGPVGGEPDPRMVDRGSGAPWSNRWLAQLG